MKVVEHVGFDFFLTGYLPWLKKTKNLLSHEMITICRLQTKEYNNIERIVSRRTEVKQMLQNFVKNTDFLKNLGNQYVFWKVINLQQQNDDLCSFETELFIN